MNEQAIFVAALDYEDPVERAAYLARVCEGKPALLEQVQALLAEHERSGVFLDVPALHQVAGGRGEDPSSPAATEAEHVDGEDDIDLSFLLPSIQPGSLGRLGHYEVQEVIGRGGCGTVLKAFDEILHRLVAIKVMTPEMAATSPARKRFLREARAAAAIRHENVISIHAVEEKPLPFLVMEYIAGQTLQQKLDQNGPLPVEEVVHIGQQIAAGLEAAHAIGLIHRDIKPSNVLLEQGRDRIKITDFGLARTSDDASITQSGVIAGTPLYMSPEQAQGTAIDYRSDLFSLGSVLYVMCSGRPPFRAATTMAVLKRVTEDDPRPIHEIIPEAPEWLIAIVNRLLAKQPADRFASAQEVAGLLARCLAELQHRGRVESLSDLLPPPVKPSDAEPKAAEQKAVEPEESKADEPTPATEGGTRLPAGRFWMGVAALLLVLLVGLGTTEATGVTGVLHTVIRLFSPDGTLVVEVDDPGVSVSIDGEDMVITGAGIKEIRLKAGQHQVLARKDGKVVKQELITIAKNGRQVVRVSKEVEPGPIKPPPVAVDRRPQFPTDGWVQLFNGKDLTGWSRAAAGIGNWKVVDGAITSSGPEDYLYSERKDFGDFHLRAEAKINKVGNSGILFRASKPMRGSSEYEAHIANTLAPGGGELTGSLWHLAVVKDPLVPPDTWFTYEIIAQGNRIRLLVNGKETADFGENRPGRSTAGYIALQHHRFPGSEVHFRKIEVRELKEGGSGSGANVFKNSLGMEFALIPKGKAWLGGGSGKPGDKEVEFQEDFYLGVYEVTQEEWEQVMAVNPSHFSRTGGGKDAVKDIPDAELKRFPVEMVSWDDAQLFLKRLNLRDPGTGWLYRLPTEAEWEYACRGGPMREKYEGTFDYYLEKPSNELTAGQSNFEHGQGLKRACKVGSYKPNGLGLHDMHANAWEWCHEDVADVFNPKISAKVYRGGCWFDRSDMCKALSRYTNAAHRRTNNIGLRVARVRAVVADPDRRAAEWVLSIGGQVEVGVGDQVRAIKAPSELPRGPFVLITLNLYGNTQLTDAGLSAVEDCRSLRNLVLTHSNVTDESLRYFRKCESLASLAIGHTQVTDAGLASFRGCVRITILDFGNSRIGDAGLAHFKECKELTQLLLGRSQVTDAGLVHFQGCQNLTFLALDSTRVTDAGLANFQDCAKLTNLNLNGMQIGDEGLANFKNCTNLKYLGLGVTQTTDRGLALFKDCRDLAEIRLDKTQVTDVGLAALKACQNLQRLNLADTQVSDAGLEALADLKMLQTVDLQNTKITAQGLRKLAGSLPQCRLEWQADPDRRAAEWVLSIGGSLRDGKAVLFKAGDKIPAGELKLGMANVTGNPQATDAGLAAFQGCRNLVSLYLSGTPLTDAGLAAFTDCKDHLKALMLDNTAVTDQGLALFKDHKHLEQLGLSGTRITDQGLIDFGPRANIGRLILGETAIGDAGFAVFKNCKKLASLDLRHTRVTEAGLAQLRECHDLMFVHLDGLKIGDSALANFKECKDLRELNLNETQVGDAGLEHLMELKTPGVVRLRQTKVTEAGVKKLAAARPELRIEWDGGVIKRD